MTYTRLTIPALAATLLLAGCAASAHNTDATATPAPTCDARLNGTWRDAPDGITLTISAANRTARMVSDGGQFAPDSLTCQTDGDTVVLSEARNIGSDGYTLKGDTLADSHLPPYHRVFHRR